MEENFSLTSPAFENEDWIPAYHACDKLGSNQSPQLQWQNAPTNVKSFALTCTDPDAPKGLFTHWIIYNIPSSTTKLDEGIVREEALPNGVLQGINGFQKIGYDGPCPPAGLPHHYIFTLYALNQMLKIKGEATLEAFDNAAASHVIKKTELIGLFQR